MKARARVLYKKSWRQTLASAASRSRRSRSGRFRFRLRLDGRRLLLKVVFVVRVQTEIEFKSQVSKPSALSTLAA